MFSGFSGGLGSLLGATGGFVCGFIPMTVIAGIAIEYTSNRCIHTAGMMAGCMMCYLFGTLWYGFHASVSINHSFTVCVLPFIPVDLLKIAFTAFIGPILHKRLNPVKKLLLN